MILLDVDHHLEAGFVPLDLHYVLHLGKAYGWVAAGAVRLWMKVYSNTSLTWSDLSFLRCHTRLPILLKGILHPDDARKAVARAWLHCRRLSR